MLIRHRPHGIVVAIDGPSGAGKSTVARLLAERLGYIQIDTGAMYRAAAFLLADGGIELSDLAGVEEFCRDLEIRFELFEGQKLVFANNRNVTDLIRTPEMSLLTSRTSALKLFFLKLNRCSFKCQTAFDSFKRKIVHVLKPF